MPKLRNSQIFHVFESQVKQVQLPYRMVLGTRKTPIFADSNGKIELFT